MKAFLDSNFLLENGTAEKLFHEYAESMPILDYHNHLQPDQIAQNKRFDNITQAWLNGDHYKWRVMRAHGIAEDLITGTAPDQQKFMKWAETVPGTIGNPLFHWTHLELQRIFGISELLNPKTADAIYAQTSVHLQQKLPVRSILEKFKVRILCTTDDPIDSLMFHEQIAKDYPALKVLPAFRPDRAMAVESAANFNQYINLLAGASEIEINSWNSFWEALKSRHAFFHDHGCRMSDHGLETFYSADYKESEVVLIFLKIRSGRELFPDEVLQFKSACLLEFAQLDAAKGWTQQFHIGALRNNSSRLQGRLGADSGADSIGDFSIARPMSRFFDKLDRGNNLAKTIVYNLNPAWNEVFATMVGNFNDGVVPGKMQFGSAWWFLDQKDGIESQLRTLANMGLLSRFVGMLTDSRSFLSFPRHEYFRRILCQYLGDQVEKGQLPQDLPWLGKIVQDICYNNAERYFNF